MVTHGTVHFAHQIPPFKNLNDSQFFLLHNDLMGKASDDLILCPGKFFNHFIEFFETLSINFEDDDVNDGIFNQLNSKYFNIHNFNKIKSDQ